MIDAEPAVALHAARNFVGSALDEATAAARIAWESVAADHFRAKSAGLTRVLAADLDALDDALRQVRRLE